MQKHEVLDQVFRKLDVSPESHAKRFMPPTPVFSGANFEVFLSYVVLPLSLSFFAFNMVVQMVLEGPKTSQNDFMTPENHENRGQNRAKNVENSCPCIEA